MGTQVIRCSCKHPFQDSLYGVGNRIGNEQKSGMIRCTVCGTVGGTKSTFVAAKPASVAPAPVEKTSKNEDGKKERKSSKFKTKEKEKKPSAKDAKAPKGKIEKKAGKGGKKK